MNCALFINLAVYTHLEIVGQSADIVTAEMHFALALKNILDAKAFEHSEVVFVGKLFDFKIGCRNDIVEDSISYFKISVSGYGLC